MELYQQEKNFFKANEAKMLETMEEDRQRQMKECVLASLLYGQD